MLAVKGVYKNLGGREVLHDVSLNVSDKQRIALVGPNGVGKTSLLKIIAGIERW